MKKKKGFTLIEVIVSIAIFAIALTYISAASEAGNAIFKNENKKQETITSTQQLMEVLKSKDKVEDFYKEDLKKFYIGFNYDELNSISEELNSIKSSDIKSKDWHKDVSTEGYKECKSIYNDKALGALVEITDEKLDEDNYSVYKLKVTVWNLKESNNYESNLSSYVSR